MQHRYSFLLVLPLLFSTAVLYLLLVDDLETTSINAVIGDESYIQLYGEKPDKTVSDFIRIQAHLQYVESILRNRPVAHLTESQRKNREYYLNLLTDYALFENFSHNNGHPDRRMPAFISVVGYLVKKTADKAVAEVINEQLKYAYISEVDHPAFLKWAEISGFTIEELAMLQPAYDTL